MSLYNYPFGSPMPSRSFSASSYRYGFNGQEKDKEISGDGNTYNFGDRIYDSRICKFFSVDPDFSKYPYQGTYVYAEDCPVKVKDLKGRGTKDKDKPQEKLSPNGVGAKYDKCNCKNPFKSDNLHGLTTPPSSSGNYSDAVTAVNLPFGSNEGNAFTDAILPPQLVNSVTEVSRNMIYKYNEDHSELTITTIRTETTLYPSNLPLSGKISENIQKVTNTTEVYKVVVAVQLNLFSADEKFSYLQPIGSKSGPTQTLTGKDVNISKNLQQRFSEVELSNKQAIKDIFQEGASQLNEALQIDFQNDPIINPH